MGHNPVGVLETVNLRAVHCSSICFYDESFLALNKFFRGLWRLKRAHPLPTIRIGHRNFYRTIVFGTDFALSDATG